MGNVRQLRPDTPAAPDTAAAIAAFLGHLESARKSNGRPYSEATVRNYRMSLERALDASALLADLDTEAGAARLRTRMAELWGQAAPSTWNARRAAVASALSYWREKGWITSDPLAGTDRAAEPAEREDVISRADIARALRSRPAGDRDGALWSLLYDSAARAEEVLALNVEDLDLSNRRARVRRKGGGADTIAWSAKTAARLSKYLSDRASGPVFLSDRAAWGASRGRRMRRDIDPDSGRGRLGYRQVHAVLKRETGWTPHRLRHAALTHAAEDGMPTELLMTKSGHASVRSLQRYARPSVDALQRWEEERRR